MRHIFVCSVTLLLSLLLVSGSYAQTPSSIQWRDVHKTKKKETLYSISRQYGVTINQLMDANPEMRKPDYKLKKGDLVYIPFASAPTGGDASHVAAAVMPADGTTPLHGSLRSSVRIGVMLPLNDKTADGQRMLEYYRGLLMACDSLKRLGISTDVYAWNVDENTNLRQILQTDSNAATCQLIVGPFHSRNVTPLADFCRDHGVKLLVPFSVQSQDIYSNPSIFQVYQSQNEQHQAAVRRFLSRFKGYHPVIVDCADSTSTKGPFTSLLRRELESRGIDYSLTSLKSSEENFQKAFSPDIPNVVVLNSSRMSTMLMAFGSLSGVALGHPETRISVLGYTEWLGYTKRAIDQFFKYDVHIATPFFTNLLSPDVEAFSRIYQQYFGADMMPILPRQALTGFDHTMFFVLGLHSLAADFCGAAGQSAYRWLQTPLRFERMGSGGFQNKTFMFVHYKPDNTVETLTY